ncbi:hypothetical protein [Saccharopolyspora shandongensis]|uniref:hypothetical protein n=1 Tax=Saccharopolyspora shandongensis TaxID=418495 RepID=UPI0034037CF7
MHDDLIDAADWAIAQGYADPDRIGAEDEGHGFENPENQVRLYRAIERHFAEHLGGRRDTAAPA